MQDAKVAAGENLGRLLKTFRKALALPEAALTKR
jgi:hypothetical protein